LVEGCRGIILENPPKLFEQKEAKGAKKGQIKQPFACLFGKSRARDEDEEATAMRQLTACFVFRQMMGRILVRGVRGNTHR
jgi:hypothetical protein